MTHFGKYSFDKNGEAIPYETPATETKKVVVFGKPYKTEPKTYTIGDMFITSRGLQNKSNDAPIYLLAQTEQNKVQLINMKTGNRYFCAYLVCNLEGITEEEFKSIAGRYYADLVKITSIEFNITKTE